MNKIVIIGLGYVGLPLARLFATKYQVVGFDINQKRIKRDFLKTINGRKWPDPADHVPKFDCHRKNRRGCQQKRDQGNGGELRKN